MRDGARAIREALVAWYAGARRDLPWRRTRDPYAIWLSEIMLQQTRVDTVIPYYTRFMQRFPTVESLAAAELPDVLTEWSGLGYYRRARSLHAAAQQVVTCHDGVVPDTRDALLALPGIGRYTAGAIASIAFDERAPIVDGNVTRVLARLHCIEDDVARPATSRRIWALAEELADSPAPGDVNQSLMELGATVCTPTNPHCGGCPVVAHCAAHRSGVAERLPNKAPKKKPRELRLISVVASCGDEVLLGKRAASGLFGGLWEPPMIPAGAAEGTSELLRQVGVGGRAKLERIGDVRHVLTHRVMNVEVHRGRARRPWKLRAPPAREPSNYAAVAWAAPSAVPLSKLARKILSVATIALMLVGLAASFFAPCDAWAQRSSGKSAKPPSAQKSAGETKDDGDSDEVTEADLELYRKLNRERGGYGRLFVTLGAGKGLRFNNPFRLRDQLGDTPESVSATAAYFDLSMNATFGEPDGLQHGGSIHFAAALEGVAQQAFSGSYLLLHRGRSPVMLYGRLGVSLLTAPDFNAGGELAFGAAYFFTGGLGITTELVGNLFYGAGTYEAEVTAVPVVSAQGGLIFDFEVLP